MLEERRTGWHRALFTIEREPSSVKEGAQRSGGLTIVGTSRLVSVRNHTWSVPLVECASQSVAGIASRCASSVSVGGMRQPYARKSSEPVT